MECVGTDMKIERFLKIKSIKKINASFCSCTSQIASMRVLKVLEFRAEGVVKITSINGAYLRVCSDC